MTNGGGKGHEDEYELANEAAEQEATSEKPSKEQAEQPPAIGARDE